MDGTPACVETLRRRAQGAGVINTAYIERLNATCRERLASLTRRGRALARRTLTLQHGFCTPHASLRLVAPRAGMRCVPEDTVHGRRDHGSWLECASTVVLSRAAVLVDATHRGRPSHALKRLIAQWCGDHG